MTDSNWESAPIGSLFEIGAGKTMSAAARNGSNKVPFLRTSNVLWDQIDLSQLDEMSISADELSEKSLLPGDLLVCEGGEIGRAAIWDGQVDVVSFQNHIHRLRPRVPTVYPRFYVYFLQSAFTQLGIFEGAGNRTTIPNLSRNRLSDLQVPCPPLKEQMAIANALSAVRSSIEAHDGVLNCVTELKRSTENHVFVRGLRGEALKETETGQVPVSWEVATLGSIGRIGNGSTPKRTNPSYWKGGTYPWLTSAKVYDRDVLKADEYVTSVALDECHLPRVSPGALLIAITGQGKTLGHCAVLRIDATVSQHIAYVEANPGLAIPSFLRGFMETQYEHLRQIGSGGGSTKGALTCGVLRDLSVPLPPLDEQREIVEILDAIDRKIELHRRKREVLEELFKSLLHKLMTGEVRVSDLDLSALEEVKGARRADA